MAVTKFEELLAWQKAQDLTVSIYSVFSDSSDFGFRDQICRAVVSISNNIAEGFDRNTNKEFIRFLYIAKGSCSEVRSMLHLSTRLGLANKKQQEVLLKHTDEVSRLIWGIIRALPKQKPSSQNRQNTVPGNNGNH